MVSDARLDTLVREGARARAEGAPESACPYGVTDIMRRCAWLAGWRDAA